MTPSKSCLLLARHSSSRDTFHCRSSLWSHCNATRAYVAAGPPKPRPYDDPPRSRPLVGVRKPPPAATPPTSISSAVSPTAGNAPPSAPPPPNPQARGVAYPYLRISIGVVLCGSIIYSMVPPLPQSASPKLTV